MKVSVIINSYFIDNEKPNILKRCMDSFKEADEVIALATIPESKISFADGYNRIVKISTGDFIVVVGDNFTCEGNVRDLCIPNKVTVPNINNIKYPGEWMMAYCMPRNIYKELSKEFGLYDPIFFNGSHWEDTDLWRRTRSKYNIIGVETVNFYKPEKSRTIYNMPNYLNKIEINKTAYANKWGDNSLGPLKPN